MQHTSASAELVRITGLSQDLTVGVGSALASVRTLTNVSLSVHAQELVVLSGTRGAGERALLAVIAGDRRGVSGTCDVSVSIRIRLMRIQAQAALALTQEWARATLIPPAEIAGATKHAPELFLLDVEPTTSLNTARAHAPRPWSEDNRSALLAWAALCRARGGAVVMAAGQSLGEGLFTHALAHNHRIGSHLSSASRRIDVARGRVHANPRPLQTHSVFERQSALAPVRVVVMHSGRLAPSIQLDAHDLIDC
jgi:hypothetical protein